MGRLHGKLKMRAGMISIDAGYSAATATALNCFATGRAMTSIDSPARKNRPTAERTRPLLSLRAHAVLVVFPFFGQA
jgi:hypothetical protein